MKKIILGLQIFCFAQNLYSQWIQMPPPAPATLNGVSFINVNTGWVCTDKKTLKTTNAGINWQVQDTIEESGFLTSLVFLNINTGYVVDFFGGFYKTTNSGNNWLRSIQSFGYAATCTQFLGVNTGFIGGVNNFFRTTDGGTTFLPTNNTNTIGSLFFVNDMTGWCSSNNILYKTTNAGVQFEQTSFGGNISAMHFPNSLTGYLSANLIQGLYKTTNGGENWIVLSSTAQFGGVTALDFINAETGWASAGNSRIINTIDGGNNWRLQFELNERPVYDITHIDNNNLWAVGRDSLICKTTNGGVGVQQISTTIPDKFYLEQNYPNPFNPVTNIEFSLPQKTFVKLKVFDLLGREIANLVNENLSVGKYKYDFNASALPSGIYFYKLETENFSETRKMVLVK